MFSPSWPCEKIKICRNNFERNGIFQECKKSAAILVEWSIEKKREGWSSGIELVIILKLL